VERDHVDVLIGEWQAVRPDLELAPMATFGRLGWVHTHARRAIDAVFERHGLTLGEFDVLAALRRTAEPRALTPTALSHLLLLSPAGMTNRLDRLEAGGLIERRPDPKDGRSSLVVLTASGRSRVDAAVSEHLDNEASLLAGLSRAERRTLDELLRKLLASLEA